MNLENIKNEYKAYNLDDKTLEQIFKVYKATAVLMTFLLDDRITFSKHLLSFCFNTVKYLITQLIELSKHEETKGSRPSTI